MSETQHKRLGRWFRFYESAAYEPKTQSLSGDQFKTWINLLCFASENGGAIPSINELTFLLRPITEKELRKRLDVLVAARLIDDTPDGFRPHNWDTRQFKSDGSTERVQRFRARQGNVSCNVSETG